MKRIISIVIASMLLLSLIPFAAFAANGPELTVEVSDNACNGQEFVVTVSIKDAKFSSIDLALVAPAGFTVVDATPVNFIQGAYTFANSFYYTFATTTDVVYTGPLCRFTVKANSAVQVGDYDFSVAVSEYMNDANVSVDSSTASDKVAIVEHGDADKDCVCDVCGSVIDCVDNDGNGYCDVCGKDICVHVFTNYVYNNDATFGVDGTETAECDNRCGRTHTRTKPGTALAVCSHNIDSKVIFVDIPTCNTEGRIYSKDTCTVVGCGYVKVSVKVVPAPGHYDANNDDICDDCGESVSGHVHNIAYVPAAEACHVPGTAEFWYCTDPTCEIVFADEACTQVTNRKNLAIAPDCELAYVPAAEACHVPGTAEYWYCPECEAVYADAEGTVLTNRKNLATEPVCELAYVPAAEACHVPGTAEYWYCVKCEAVYADAEGTQLTNRKNLAIEPVCELAYVPAAEACHVAGSAEYWYCVKCEAVYADAEGTQLTNRKNLATEAVIELVHHEAIAPCHANGYLEYWYCPKCDNYFADAAATQQTNIKNLTVEGDLSKLVYTAKVEATATENGMNEYWYCAGCDCFFTDAEGKYNIAYLSLTIPATGEIDNPQTGDNAIFFIVAVVAVATLGIAAVSFKKREEN